MYGNNMTSCREMAVRVKNRTPTWAKIEKFAHFGNLEMEVRMRRQSLPMFYASNLKGTTIKET